MTRHARAAAIGLALWSWTTLTAADATSVNATITTVGATTARNATSAAAVTPEALGYAWLKAHQRDDGSWSGADDPSGPGWDAAGDDLAATALALDASGHFFDIDADTYQKSESPALAYLLDHQQDDGSYGTTFTTAVVTGVWANLSGFDDDTMLWPTQHGMNALRARQSANGAWGTGGPTAGCDTRITAWCVMTLKSCAAPHLRPGLALVNAAAWFATEFQAANPGWAGFDPTRDDADFPARMSATPAVPATPAATAASATDPQVIAAAAVCAEIFTARPEELRDIITSDSTPTDAPVATGPAPVSATTAAMMFATLANRLVSPAVCRAAGGDAMTAYLGTRAASHLDDAHWNTWKTGVVDLIRANQHREAGDRFGSWDPPVHGGGLIDGRVAATALNIMTLQIAYRRDHPIKWSAMTGITPVKAKAK